MEPLPRAFFNRSTEHVARELLGSLLVREESGEAKLVGRIVETEAYTENDPACHAAELSFEERTGYRESPARGADLFTAPGWAYVYLIYGMHWLLNVVTEPEGTAGAVLIRAVEPVVGVDVMDARRGVRRRVDLTNGPGKVTDAFNISDDVHLTDLTAPPLYFSEGSAVSDDRVETTSRIGISKGIDREWRWFIRDSDYVSKAAPSDQ